MQLNNIATIYSGYTFRTHKETSRIGEVGLLSAKDIDPASLRAYPQEYIGLEQIKRPEYIQQGDILLSNRGIIKAGVYHEDIQAIAGQTLTIIRLKENTQYLPEYLAILFNSNWGSRIFNKHATGATIKQLPISILKDLDIPDVPLETQKTIIDLWQTFAQYDRVIQHKISIQKNIIDQTITNTLCHNQ